MALRSLLLWTAFCSTAGAQSSSSNNLVITTNTGTYTGIINGTTPNVRQFLNIPYALAPVGQRRWQPPAKTTTNSSTQIDATQFPPSCAQYLSKSPSVYNQDVIEFIIPPGTDSPAAGDYAQSSAEDCLSLAIWTPTGNVSSLPVIMFITGGGFNNGGINIQYQLPHHWVQRTQAHVVVTINYRLSILGFPNAAGLDSQNLGLLDQRMALEWIRDNIKAFGGDPSKITIWGQSAGAVSVDYQNFAFHSDPIASGLFMQSGTALLPITTIDPQHTNFSFVASHLGCGNLNATAELSCMRKVPARHLVNFVGHYGDNGTSPSISFHPVPDDTVVFTNYTARYAAGLVSHLPAIVSNAADEGAGLVTYPVHNVTAGPYQAAANAVTLGSFICPSHNTSLLRTAQNLTTYRYQYAGNFSNISPLKWMGAYHDSDLPMLFGTYGEFRGQGTAFEGQVSARMQDLVLAFMNDPASGPRAMSWGEFQSGEILRLAADSVLETNVSVQAVDGACYGAGMYNPSP